MPPALIQLPAKKVFIAELRTWMKLALVLSKEKKPSLHDFVINLSPIFFSDFSEANYPYYPLHLVAAYLGRIWFSDKSDWC